MELLEFVSNEPLKDEGPTSCPHCDGTDLQLSEQTTTLVAGPEGINHVWTKAYCMNCSIYFVVETKGGYRWITQNQRVLKGMPACYESYTLTHRDCGGDVKRQHFNLDGSKAASLSTVRIDGAYIKQYYAVFSCDKCGASLKSDIDYWRPASA